ncbi:MAG: hypothetical protein WB646_17525 [Steroidobacteraceae bacterium]
MVAIYANLLTLFALGSARGSGTYESSQILVSAVLSVGLDVKACRALIADVEELAGEGFGLEMVYWVLEIIEDFMRASTPAAEAREIFLHGALSRMAPIYARLSSLQRTAVAHLACELGWTLQSFGITCEQDGPEDITKENPRPTHRNLFIDRVLEPPSEGGDRGTRTDSGRRLQCRSWRHGTSAGAR